MTQMMTFKAGQANAIYDAVPTTAAQLRDAGYTLHIAPGVDVGFHLRFQKL